MIRQAPRHLLRCSRPLYAPRTHRFLSTAPPAQKSRSWKSSAVRWGLAIGVVYYYNTSNLFAEEPPFAAPQPQSPTDETPLPTLESLASSRRQQLQPSALPPPSSDSPTPTPEPSPLSDPSSLESEASQEGAFNEETGVINWDCPCLGGMAHGPCGEQFKAAFSCFVYSKEEVKGMDCIEHFRTMQDCFREFPDVYGGELEEDKGGEGGGEVGGQGEGPGVGSVGATAMEDDDAAALHLENTEGAAIPAAATSAVPTPKHEVKIDQRKGDETERAKKATEQVRREHGEGLSESETVVPKAALDATGEK